MIVNNNYKFSKLQNVEIDVNHFALMKQIRKSVKIITKNKDKNNDNNNDNNKTNFENVTNYFDKNIDVNNNEKNKITS